jgi:FkbM family methyltransferase
VTGDSLKRFARRAFAAAGYAVRDVGHGVAGVDLLHDARVLMGDTASPVLFDIGANIGQTALAMLDAFREPQIWSFEPSPTTFEILRKAVDGRPGVTTEAIAFGEAVSTLPFHVTRDHSVNDSLLSPAWNAGGSVVEVRVETVDHYCQALKIDRISLLKVDAQGYDLKVLEGARQMLAKRKVHLYCCEANFEHMYEGQATLLDLLAFAESVGYRLVGFYGQTYVNDRLSYLDALFIGG